MKEKCSFCRYWEFTEATFNGMQGCCRRRSPVPAMGNKNDEIPDYDEGFSKEDIFFWGIFPFTCSSDWCGDFEKKIEA